jgi:hypothetical protein
LSQVAGAPAAEEEAGDQDHDHGADDGRDDAAEVEDVGVTDAEEDGEDQVAEDGAGQAEGDRGQPRGGAAQLRNTSPGVSILAITPATRPGSTAPSMTHSFCG